MTECAYSVPVHIYPLGEVSHIIDLDLDFGLLALYTVRSDVTHPL